MASKTAPKENYTVLISMLIVGIVIVALLFSPHSSTINRSTVTSVTIIPVQPNATLAYVYPYSYPNSTVNASINVTYGSTFIAQVSSNAGSTGYDWIVSASTGLEYLNYTVVSTSNLTGGPQIRDYYFHAVQAGGQLITFKDARPWLPSVIAAEINLNVSVS